MTRLTRIDIDDTGAPDPDIEHERRVAIFDLLEANTFDVPGVDHDTLHLRLAIRDARLAFVLSTPAEPATAFHLSLAPFRQVVRDYAQIRQSYSDAVRNLPPARIEALDQARRAIHAEGARILTERLSDHATTDPATARHLFTLICVLLAEP